MTKPIRIQRKRTKGFKLPPNTVCVTRPGKWGNPFKVGQQYMLAARADEREVRHVQHSVGGGYIATLGMKGRAQDGIPLIKFADGPLTIDTVLGLYRGHILETVGSAEIKRELRGKNLACFCPLTSPCHADVLLELANA